jgi:hypothetical protein
VRILGKYENNTSSNHEFYNNRFDGHQGKSFESDQDLEYNQYNRNQENRNSYNDMTSWNTTGFFDRDRNLYSTPETNIETIEKFHLFESAPRYGIHHNLLFSVSLFNLNNVLPIL